MPDVEGKEDLSDETQQVLPPRKWNKDVEGAWRMDINVVIVEDIKEHESICDVGSDLNDDNEGSGLELETDLSDEEDSDSESKSD
jgi:hypothetical protein